MFHDQRFMTPVLQGIWIKPGVELSDFTAFLEIDQARSLEGQFLKIIRLWEQADFHKMGSQNAYLSDYFFKLLVPSSRSW